MAVKKVSIKAIDFVASLRSGMDDGGLMRKFDLGANGLHVVFQRLLEAGILRESELSGHHLGSTGSVVLETAQAEVERTAVKKPVIDAADALKCLRSGMDDTGLMRRYNISAKGVRSLFRKLKSAGIITPEELEKRDKLAGAEVSLDERVSTQENDEQRFTDEDLGKLAELIVSGLTHKSLIEDHGYQSNRLQDMVKELLRNGSVTHDDLHRERPGKRRELTIKNKHTGEVIHSGEAGNFRSLVERAVAKRVDLTGADLSGSDLSNTDLSGAMLLKADLSKSILVGVDFTGANLREALLSSSDMFGAILYKANLTKADLSDANMAHVYGVWAFMPHVNLSEANLTCAELAGANLAGANLFECMLDGANLLGVYWEGAKRFKMSEGN